MKIKFIYLLFALSIGGNLFAQDSNSNVKVGDTYVIAEVDNNNYKHINFPKENFIIKKGGIVNFDRIKGEKIEVVDIKEKKDGTEIATIKLVSGKKFFNSHRSVTVNIEDALAHKELLKK